MWGEIGEFGANSHDHKEHIPTPCRYCTDLNSGPQCCKTLVLITMPVRNARDDIDDEWKNQSDHSYHWYLNISSFFIVSANLNRPNHDLLKTYIYYLIPKIVKCAFIPEGIQWGDLLCTIHPDTFVHKNWPYKNRIMK